MWYFLTFIIVGRHSKITTLTTNKNKKKIAFSKVVLKGFEFYKRDCKGDVLLSYVQVLKKMGNLNFIIFCCTVQAVPVFSVDAISKFSI